jgi:kynureninase
MEQYNPARSFADEMDAGDPLRSFREKFFVPADTDGRESVYLTGNSLGLQPRSARDYIEQELADWETLGVEGHFNARSPWMPYHELLTESMARIVGALPLETVVMNSLTVNLHLLMVSFYRPTAARFKIVIESDAFPSDLYAVKSQLRFHGLDPADALIEIKPREGEDCLRVEDIEETIADNAEKTALVLLGGVNYYTGQAFDMRRIAAAAHNAGAVAGFDLAHAAGNIELALHEWDVDFAVWCSYKYLNSGPGGTGGAFVHERHAANFALPRFAGWWGHDKETRFLMGRDFVPIMGAEGWQVSNPAILQLAALRASLEIFDEAGIKPLREKSLKLTGYLEYLLREIRDSRIHIVTPSEPDARGCQLSIRVRDADKSLLRGLLDRGVIADWREPDVIRVAPVPLYNSFADVFRFYEILKNCLAGT